MTSIKLLSLFVSLSLCQLLSAQVIRFNPGDTTYVFGDKINVRTQPATDAAVVTQLIIGDEVIITEVSEQMATISGLNLPWCKVQFKGGQSGYIWGGLLSVLGCQKIGDVKFVANATNAVIKSQEEGLATYTIETRATRRGGILDKMQSEISSEGSIYQHPIMPKALGLKGYTAMLHYTFGYEACGYPWTDIYTLWNGTKLVPLPTCISIADAGVFSHTESYIFPEAESEGIVNEYYGTGEEIFYMVEHHEREELEDGSGWNDNSWSRVRKMIWDGKKWNKPAKMDEP